ncbi:hypothetical protein EJB05_19314, partial [Eragrostis curvula]
MAAGNFHAHRHIAEGAAMVHDTKEIDLISGLPDDILVDILERLVTAGEVRTVTRTSILSRRWRFLPWPQLTSVALDVGDFFFDSDDEWLRVRRRRAGTASAAFWDQHRATAAFTDSLARFLAAPASERVIEKLSLKFILTRRDLTTGDLSNMIGYSKRFTDFLSDCPHGVLARSLTKLYLQFLWFEDQEEGKDVLGKLVRGCAALESLHVRSCGLFRPRLPDDDRGVHFPAVMTVDAPAESRLKTLVLDGLFAWQVDLVRAPALVEVRLRWFLDNDHPPVSFGCTPSLKRASLRHRPFDKGSDSRWRLSEIWLQPEHPRELKVVLRGLKELHLADISPGYSLFWTLFLLEAAPFLETLDIHIFDHICTAERRKKHRVNTNLKWQPSPGFITHHNLKKLSFHRAFHVNKDLRFAKHVMALAVNLETLTMGVKSLGCEDCMAEELKFPEFARPRLSFAGKTDYVDMVVKKLKDGISTPVHAGPVKNVELADVDWLPRGHFMDHLKYCPWTFRFIMKLRLHELWFTDPAVLNSLVVCTALLDGEP